MELYTNNSISRWITQCYHKTNRCSRNTSAVSAPTNFIVDTSAVTEPTITKVVDDTNPQIGDIPTGASTNDTTPLQDEAPYVQENSKALKVQINQVQQQ